MQLAISSPKTKPASLEWDHGNRLASHRTENPAGGDPSLYTQYRYDNNNRRTQKIVRNGAEELRVTITLTLIRAPNHQL